MVKTSVMGITRCRICRFELGTVAGGQGSGGPTRRRTGGPVRGRGGVAWWALGARCVPAAARVSDDAGCRLPRVCPRSDFKPGWAEYSPLSV
jgi:hypothetical protein